jgi:hypothetical protein
MIPLVAAHIDLRDFAFMPLDVVRLRDSDLAAIASGDAFRAAVMLWCAAWHQVPAASLPADDRMLARLGGYGRDIDGWKSVKEEALRGFVECDDGRLYHGVIAEKAREAWEAKEARKARTAAALAARLLKSAKPERSPTSSEIPEQRYIGRDIERNVEHVDQRSVHQGTGTGTGTGTGNKEEDPVSLRSTASPEKRQPRKTRLMAEWVLPDSLRSFAITEGLSDAEIDREALTFRDWWLREGEAKADWFATWRGWIRRSIDRGKSSARAPPFSSKTPRPNPYLEHLKEMNFNGRPDPTPPPDNPEQTDPVVAQLGGRPGGDVQRHERRAVASHPVAPSSDPVPARGTLWEGLAYRPMDGGGRG